MNSSSNNFTNLSGALKASLHHVNFFFFYLFIYFHFLFFRNLKSGSRKGQCHARLCFWRPGRDARPVERKVNSNWLSTRFSINDGAFVHSGNTRKKGRFIGALKKRWVSSGGWLNIWPLVLLSVALRWFKLTYSSRHFLNYETFEHSCNTRNKAEFPQVPWKLLSFECMAKYLSVGSWCCTALTQTNIFVSALHKWRSFCKSR